MAIIHTKNITKTNNSPRDVMLSKPVCRHFIWRIITIFITICSCFVFLSHEAKATDVTFTLDNSQTVLEVTVPSMVNLNLAPTMGRAFDTQSMDIKVGTNNPTGYTLNMQASSATLTRTSDAGDSVPTIAPMLTTGSATGYTAAQFEAGSSDADTLNRWGYKLSSATNFMPMTTDELVLASTEAAGNANTTTLNFAAKVDTSQPVGTYATTLTFTAVTNVIITKTYMQNISEATLASLMPNIGDEVMLYDSRDEKGYTVAKLADDNYWMTQNLDLDLDDTVTYTSADTDVLEDWTPSVATYATGYYTWEISHRTPESYDPGDVCWNGTLDEDWSTTLDNGTVACGDDKHYHIGNYYNWTAAVAMNDSSSYSDDDTDVNQSICPAGWRLPSGTNTWEKTFQYLADQANLTSGTDGNIQNAPAYFVYGGSWFSSSDGVGSCGGYWSSVVGSSDGAYGLYFRIDGYLDPQFVVGRDNGLSVRCVAR